MARTIYLPITSQVRHQLRNGRVWIGIFRSRGGGYATPKILHVFLQWQFNNLLNPTLPDRGVRFLGISGKGVALCRCFDGHNKNPTNCLWHGSPTIGLTSSVHPHIYVLSQIWLKHLRMWRKTKTYHFNSTLYVFLSIHVIHIWIIVILFEYIIFLYLSVWQFLPFIFNYPCIHGSLPSTKKCKW